MADAMKDGDDPAVVAKVIVTAATGKKPKLRYPPALASSVTKAHRFGPAGVIPADPRKIVVRL